MFSPLLVLLLAQCARAAVWVPAIFSDGMVLQEHATIDQRPFVYGTSQSPNELVTVVRSQPNGRNDTYPVVSSATPNADGDYAWVSQIDPDYFPAKENNLTFYIYGSLPPLNVIVIREAVYGDVFLCRCVALFRPQTPHLQLLPLCA